MTKLTYGLIGHPVEHSLSPAMHNAAFKSLGIDAEYRLFDILPPDLEKFLKDLIKNKISGVNVTVPHKVKAKEFLEVSASLDEHARKLGAVNTIKIENGALKGFNTDGPGFYRSLIEDLKFEPEGRTVFVLGAGGAARAIIMYLGNGPKKIFVTDIDERLAHELKEHYGKYYDSDRLTVTKKSDMGPALGSSDILVQATPMGMKPSDPMPVDIGLLHPGTRVYDLVYNVLATKLVEAAARKKLHAVTGLGMLLYQGAAAFELWTGKKAPVDVMRKALKEALKSQ